jgi:chemotaxis protein methyltransferase CheR
MLKARLSRRLHVLGLSTFAAYYRFLHENDPSAEEHSHFINAVTTKVTGFFREEHHFRYLREQWVPALRERAVHGGGRRIRIWSAGCSTGEEPYTIALTLRESLAAALSCWDVRILASDIDTDALARAGAGTYDRERAAPIPEALLARHFLRGTGANAGQVRTRPEMQALVAFRHINLMDDAWPINTRFDAIFCRNVLIYFDRPTQLRLVKRLATFLNENGLLFLGHSESLHGLFSGLKHIQNTIYRRIDQHHHR